MTPSIARKPRLTIGIPTYNFGSTLGETLASIAVAIRDDVEIVVVDGGSTDATPDIVAGWSRHLPLRYHRKETRDGIDVDIALTVALAEADYCWLLSADDVIEPNAIEAVLSHVSGHPDIILLSHSNCDAAMRVLQPRHGVLRGPTRRIAIATASGRHRYFEDALTTEAFFSFLSGLVVRRAAWNVERDTADLSFGSCWSHAIRLLTHMRDTGLVVTYEASPLVRRRGENDSFADRGVVARYALGIEGYRKIISDIFGADGPEYRHALRVLRTEFNPVMFMYAKRAAGAHSQREDMAALTAMFRTLYPSQPRFAVAQMIYRLPPRPFLAAFEMANAVRHRILGRSTP